MRKSSLLLVDFEGYGAIVEVVGFVVALCGVSLLHQVVGLLKMSFFS